MHSCDIRFTLNVHIDKNLRQTFYIKSGNQYLSKLYLRYNRFKAFPSSETRL